MTKWVQAIRQATTYLGLVVIAIIWGGILSAVRASSMSTRTKTPCAKEVISPAFWKNTYGASFKKPTTPCWRCEEPTKRTRNILTSQAGWLVRSLITA